MNLTEWSRLTPDEFKAKLRDAQMTRAEYDELVASIETDRQIESELRAAGTLPYKLPDGKLGDTDSFGLAP